MFNMWIWIPYIHVHGLFTQEGVKNIKKKKVIKNCPFAAILK